MPGKDIGYVRVSTHDQNTARQLDGIHLDKIFEDTSLNESSWEKAESRLQKEAVEMALKLLCPSHRRLLPIPLEVVNQPSAQVAIGKQLIMRLFHTHAHAL